MVIPQERRGLSQPRVKRKNTMIMHQMPRKFDNSDAQVACCVAVAVAFHWYGH
jgi:hypothetical protein